MTEIPLNDNICPDCGMDFDDCECYEYDDDGYGDYDDLPYDYLDDYYDAYDDSDMMEEGR